MGVMKMRKIQVLLISSLFVLLLAPAMAQTTVPQGEVTAVREDGSLTINAGVEAGFEVGDILVVQRNGVKVGLAHMGEVNPNISTATTVKVELNS